MGQVDFKAINAAAMADLPSVLRQWLPDAKVIGEELVAASIIARHPKRDVLEPLGPASATSGVSTPPARRRAAGWRAFAWVPILY